MHRLSHSAAAALVVDRARYNSMVGAPKDVALSIRRKPCDSSTVNTHGAWAHGIQVLRV